MENKIPTVLEFLKSTELIIKFDNTQGCILEEELPNLMIEFAKLHVEAALKEASEKARQIEDPHTYTGNTGSEYPTDYIIDKDSILNAYSLTLIK